MAEVKAPEAGEPKLMFCDICRQYVDLIVLDNEWVCSKCHFLQALGVLRVIEGGDDGTEG